MVHGYTETAEDVTKTIFLPKVMWRTISYRVILTSIRESCSGYICFDMTVSNVLSSFRSNLHCTGYDRANCLNRG